MATGIPKASKMPFVTPVSSSAVSWLMKKSRYQVIARLSNVVLLLGVLRVSRRLLTRMLARSMPLYGVSPTVVTPVLYVWMACSSCLKAGGSRRDYELKEATSTFELALWKSKLDQADATNTTNRDAYRIDVPGPVKDTMLQYLDPFQNLIN